MASFTLEEIKEITKGNVIQGNMSHRFNNISIDSRTLNPGDLFIALKGNNFDGHDFVYEALDRGASGAMLSRRELWNRKSLSDKKNFYKPCIILVKDTLTALQMISQYHRKRSPVSLIGVTGSNGKTTSKEMIASVLGTKFSVLKNESNYNNHIGVPLTLLKLKPSHTIAVLEMGMSGSGEIRKLCEIAQPSIGVLTNISGVHLQFLGSLEKVKDAKGELVDFIDQNGTVTLNSDDPLVMDLKERVKGRLLTYGIYSNSDIRAKKLKDLGINGQSFLLMVNSKEIAVHLSLIGNHNVYNALSAAAVGTIYGIELDNIKKGLESFRGLPMRMELCHLKHDIIIINDSYNANTSSVKGAIETLSNISKRGHSFLAVGDMLELGDASVKDHKEIGRIIAGRSIDFLIVVGEMASFIGKEALLNGMEKKNVFFCKTVDEAFKIIDKRLQSGDILLVKGSRRMKMERIVETLQKTKGVH